MKTIYRKHEIETYPVEGGFGVIIDGDKDQLKPQATEEQVIKNAKGLIDLFLQDTEDWKN